MARFAWYPVLCSAIQTHPASAMTTVIIIRFRSSPSRTCDGPAVTVPGVKRKLSCASQSGYRRSSLPPGSK